MYTSGVAREGRSAPGGKINLYYNSEVCVCVCVSVCLCRFYLKTVNGNDLILFAT